MDSSSSYLACIAYELYIVAMCCVSTIVFLSLSPLSFTAFYSMLFVEKRSDVLFCFLCFHLFLHYLFRIDDEDSLKEKDHSNSPPLSTTTWPSPFYHEPPSPSPPWRSKSSSPPVTTHSQPSPPSSSPAYSQPSSPSLCPAHSQPSPPVTTNRHILFYHEPRSSLSTPPRQSKQSSSSPTVYQPLRRSKQSLLSPACSHLPSSAPPRRSKRSSLSPACSHLPSPAPPRRSKRSSLSPACSHLSSSAPPRRFKQSSLSPVFSQPPQFTLQSPESSYLPSSRSFLSPPPLPPFKMKDWKFIREGEDYVRMASELSHSSDSDTSDINVRSDRFIAENKKRFRDEIREDQLRFLNRKMAK